MHDNRYLHSSGNEIIVPTRMRRARELANDAVTGPTDLYRLLPNHAGCLFAAVGCIDPADIIRKKGRGYERSHDF
jgi:hypothetical protein